MEWLRRGLKHIGRVLGQAVAILAVLLGAAIFGGALFCLFEWEKVSSISAQAFALGRLFAFELGLSPFSYQTFNEALFVSFSLLSMSSGLILIYEGASKPREAGDALIIAIVGLLLLLMGSVCLGWLVHVLLR